MEKEAWINFIENFTKDICNTTINLNDRGYSYFESQNVFNLNITLSNRDGFLELFFPHIQVQQDFLALANITKTSSKKNKFTMIKTNWNNSKFPCRVFVKNQKIQYYDKTNDLPRQEKFERRIVVLQSVFKVLTDMKLQKALPNDAGFSILNLSL